MSDKDWNGVCVTVIGVFALYAVIAVAADFITGLWLR